VSQGKDFLSILERALAFFIRRVRSTVPSLASLAPFRLNRDFYGRWVIDIACLWELIVCFLATQFEHAREIAFNKLLV
jgi:hypothetical protein